MGGLVASMRCCARSLTVDGGGGGAVVGLELGAGEGKG